MGHTRREQQARGKVELQEPLRAGAQMPSGLFSCHFRFSLGAAFILPSREPSPRMSMAVTTPASPLSLEWPRKERWAPLLQAELKNLQEETESGQTEKKTKQVKPPAVVRTATGLAGATEIQYRRRLEQVSQLFPSCNGPDRGRPGPRPLPSFRSAKPRHCPPLQGLGMLTIASAIQAAERRAREGSQAWF